MERSHETHRTRIDPACRRQCRDGSAGPGAALRHACQPDVHRWFAVQGSHGGAQGRVRLSACHESYLWALPVLNMYGMKEGSEKVFGKGYNVLPIFKDRLNAKTLITTPNSDVIYALGYLDLKEDGPMVIEVPPGLQGILDDFWQRPICSEGPTNGKV